MTLATNLKIFTRIVYYYHYYSSWKVDIHRRRESRIGLSVILLLDSFSSGPLCFLFRLSLNWLRPSSVARGQRAKDAGERVSLIGIPSLESVPPSTRAVDDTDREKTRRGGDAQVRGEGGEIAGTSRRGVYLARFQNLDVLYLVPFHFRRRYLSEGRQLFEINVGDSPSSDSSRCAALFSTIPRLFSNEGGGCVSDSILSL